MSNQARRLPGAPKSGGNGFQMIRAISIRNFRCFESAKLEGCARLNVIVGDNGSGKTALLEAIFLALCQNPEVTIRYRSHRGMDGQLSGSTRIIEAALWEDLFFQQDLRKTILVKLEGDGPEARSVIVNRSVESETLTFSGMVAEHTPITFSWTDQAGQVRHVTPRLGPSGIQMGTTNEDLPDFFLFAAHSPSSAGENATRFSQLSRRGEHRHFVEAISKEYDWLEDISIEVSGGAPALYATIKGTKEKRPLASVSSGINRIVGIILGLATARRSVVVVDEIENGIYYKHHAAIWSGLLNFMRRSEAQLFVSTHSEECLQALIEVIRDDPSDVALWRIERTDSGPVIRHFSGATFVAGIDTGGEVR